MTLPLKVSSVIIIWDVDEDSGLVIPSYIMVGETDIDIWRGVVHVSSFLAVWDERRPDHQFWSQLMSHMPAVPTPSWSERLRFVFLLLKHDLMFHQEHHTRLVSSSSIIMPPLLSPSSSSRFTRENVAILTWESPSPPLIPWNEWMSAGWEGGGHTTCDYCFNHKLPPRRWCSVSGSVCGKINCCADWTLAISIDLRFTISYILPSPSPIVSRRSHYLLLELN